MYDHPGRMGRSGSRTGFGQRESIGNPLNLTLGRRPIMASDSRKSLRSQASRRSEESSRREDTESVPEPPNSWRREGVMSANRSGYFAPPGQSAGGGAVLRFHAYFEEPILEYSSRSVPYHTKRIHKCVVSFYTKDATVAVDEPKIRNSGYMQGKLLKRSHVETPDGTKFAPSDFRIGEVVTIFGRNFTVADADTSTRRYYETALADALDPAVPIPDDGFAAQREVMEIKYKQHAPPPANAKENFANDSRPRSAPAVRGSSNLRAAGSKGHEVLRFFCAYQDDRHDGDRDRRYTLHYFLSDNTIEIKEKATEGVQRFPNLLRRSRLPRDAFSNPDNPLVDANEPTHVSYEDLRCGTTLVVWGRPLLLLSCDRSTEAWYGRRRITQQPLQIAADDGEKFPQTLPPFNGFGAENDLYAMGLSLQPRVIKSTQQDYQRFIKADNKVLRFECVFGHGTVSDLDTKRVFVVNYHLGDDTIMVYEPPVRNSGLEGGVFLSRGRYKKHIPDQRGSNARGAGSVLSRWLRPADFFEGNIVSFEAPSTGRLLQIFRVVRADDYTKRVEEEKKLTAGSRLSIVLEQLAERLCAARVQVRSQFAARDARKVRGLSENDFKAVLRSMEREASSPCGQLTDDAVLDEIVWQYSEAGADSDVLVRYDDFVDALVLAAPMPKVPERTASSTTTVVNKSMEKALVNALRAQIGDPSCDNGLLRKSFRSEDREKHGTVDADAWFRVLRKHKFHGVLSRVEANILKQRYTEPSVLHAGVEYERLCDKIYEGDFSDYMAALLMVLPERGDISGVDLDKYREHLEGGNKIPTVRNYLDRVNVTMRECEGNIQLKLKNCMRAFSSAFGRNHRKKMLRKHLMAFDVSNAGSCTRDEFTSSIRRIIDDGYCELDMRDQSLLFNHIFPHPWTRQPTDELLTKLVSRDVKGVMRMHQAAMSREEDPRFLFR